MLRIGILLMGLLGGTIGTSHAQSATWKQVAAPDSLTHRFRQIVWDAAHGSLLIGTWHGVYRYEEQATRWTHLTPDSIRWSGIFQAVDGSLFAWSKALYRSQDEGETWTLLQQGLPKQYPEFQSVVGMMQHPNQRLYISLSTLPIGGGGGLYVSDDGGTTWTLEDNTFVTQPFGQDRMPLALYAAPSGDLFASISRCIIDPPCLGGLFRKKNTVWREVDFWTGEIIEGYAGHYPTALLALSDSVLLAGTSTQGIRISRDAGEQWEPTSLDSLRVLALVQNAEGKVFAGTEHGVLLSNDSGTSWHVFGAELAEESVYALALSPDGFLFAATDSGLYKTIAITLPLESHDEQPRVLPRMSNYPNPFHSTTTISFDLDTPDHVSLVVYDLLGRNVDAVIGRWYPAGRHDVVWEAASRPDGVYFLHLQAGQSTETMPIVLSK